jgi:hypothetical protein
MAREARGRRQDVRCNVVVTDDEMELETVEFVLKLADF